MFCIDCAKVHLEYLIRPRGPKVLARWIGNRISSLFLHLRDILPPSITFILTHGENLCLMKWKGLCGFYTILWHWNILLPILTIFSIFFVPFLMWKVLIWCSYGVATPMFDKGLSLFCLIFIKLDSSTIEAFQKLRELTFVMEHIF